MVGYLQGGRRARAIVLAVAALVAILLALPNIPGGADRTTEVVASAVPPSGPLSLAASAGAVYSGSFAARAGYDGSVVASASGVEPASGPQSVVVSFYPRSPSFFVSPPAGARPLSIAQIADQYGLSATAYASAEGYFQSMGLSIVHSNPTRLSLTVDGTATEIGRAFGTELVAGAYAGRPATFPRTPPALPNPLESEVAAVVGLTSGLDRFTLPAGLSSALAPAGSSPAQSTDLITPSIARLIYDFSSLYNVSGSARFAAGEGIALVLWGDGYDPSDLSTFFSNDYPSSFPAPTVRAYNLDGAPPPSSSALSDPSKAPQELTLDLEWSGSMAPGATLNAVYVPDGPASDGYSPSIADITDAFTTAVTGISGVSVVSMSFGTPENASQALQAAWANDLATAAQQGITLLAATGDTGGAQGSGCSGGPSTEFPAIAPQVIAVGGTDPSLARNILGQVTGLASESAWSGSGGGYSANIAAPSWQLVGSASAPISAHGNHRGVPDVSATADYNYLYFRGQSGVAAGTSFATPLWAGLVAEMDALYGSRLGLLTPRLYSIGASQESGHDPVGLADITTGSTCIGSATPGWDPETGWGSPRALLLYEDLTATFVNLTLTATPSLVAPGGTVKLVAHLSNQTSGAPIAGIPIALSLSSSSADGPCAGVWGSHDVTTDASGTATLQVSVPSCYLGGHGSASATVTSDGYYGASSTTIDVNLLGFYPALAGIQSYPENVVAFALIMGLGSAIGYVLGRPRPRPATAPPGPSPPPSAGAPKPSARPPGSAPPPTASQNAPPPAPSPPAPPPPGGASSPPAPPSS